MTRYVLRSTNRVFAAMFDAAIDFTYEIGTVRQSMPVVNYFGL
jgi:hypothetical protein